MANINSYYLYQKFEKRGDQPWIQVYPSTYSADGDGTMPLVVKQLNDPYCNPQHRTITTGTTCSDANKYVLNEYQVSYDDGTTWTTVSSSTGSLIESNSYDCGYRTGTTTGTPYCDGYDKYIDVYSRESRDYGDTWITASTTPVLVEAQSEDCGYVPPTKYVLTLNDSSTVSGECGESNTLAQSEISAYTTTCVSAEIGNCVTIIGGSAFKDFSNLTSVNVPSGVTSIGTGAFRNCSNLTSITSLDSLGGIGNYGFASCGNLTSITIGANIANIYNYAFYNCYNLASVTIYATTPPNIEQNTFLNTTCQFYVPAESINAYKSKRYWNIMASRIQAIPT